GPEQRHEDPLRAGPGLLLSAGRHWTEDAQAQLAAADARHPDDPRRPRRRRSVLAADLARVDRSARRVVPFLAVRVEDRAARAQRAPLRRRGLRPVAGLACTAGAAAAAAPERARAGGPARRADRSQGRRSCKTQGTRVAVTRADA